MPAKKKTLQRCSLARQVDVAIGIAIEYNSFIILDIKAYAIGVVLRADGTFMEKGAKLKNRRIRQENECAEMYYLAGILADE